MCARKDAKIRKARKEKKTIVCPAFSDILPSETGIIIATGITPQLPLQRQCREELLLPTKTKTLLKTMVTPAPRR